MQLDITWINVDLSNEIYEACIGDRENNTHFESELGTCCSNLSYVRDLILFIKENKGCCIKYIKDIAYILTTSHPEFLSNDSPENLKKLFKALDIYEYIPTLE